jgi:NAD-dependent deacetylase
MKKIVLLTGAGISAESGIQTFRDSDGLWEGHHVMDVATPEGFRKNPALVLEFYNARRRQLLQCAPTAAHNFIAQLEQTFEVNIITQNVDDLHERAGSTNVLHLHGELLKSRSTIAPALIYNQTADINIGDKCAMGAQLRPHIVWFNEQVPEIGNAQNIVQLADIFVIIGTSLVVYPAAGLVNYVHQNVPIFLIDKNMETTPNIPNLTFIKKPATEGCKILFEHLMR